MSHANVKQDVFEHLSRGKFLCENSPIRKERQLFEACSSEYDTFFAYFEEIGFSLERGNEYFYFSKTFTNKTIEEKITKVYEYIDLVELMQEYSQSFGVGFRVSISELESSAKANVTLKQSIQKIRTSTKNMTLHQQCARVLEQFSRGGFMALESEHEQRYKVLSSFEYLQTFLNAIEVPHFD